MNNILKIFKVTILNIIKMRAISISLLIIPLFFAPIFSSRMKRNVDFEAYNSTAKEEKSYAIVIDVGSISTRLYAYWWVTASNDTIPKVRHLPDREGKIFTIKESAGILNFTNDINAAAQVIGNFIDYMDGIIPVDRISQVMFLVKVYFKFSCSH